MRVVGVRVEPAFGAAQARLDVVAGQGAVGFDQERRPLAAQRGFHFVHRRQGQPERGRAAGVGVDHRGHAALCLRQLRPQRVEAGAVRCGLDGGGQYLCFQRGIGAVAQRAALLQRRECFAGAPDVAVRHGRLHQFAPTARGQGALVGFGHQQRQRFGRLAFAAQHAGAQHAGRLRCGLRGLVQRLQRTAVFTAARGCLGRGQQGRAAQAVQPRGAVEVALGVAVAAFHQGDQAGAETLLAEPPVPPRERAERPARQPPQHGEQRPRQQ